MVAACDSEILGKKLEDSVYQLDVREDFYKGEVVGEEDFLQALSNATIANLVGNKIVETAMKHGFVDSANTISVKGVKHAQFVSVI